MKGKYFKINLYEKSIIKLFHFSTDEVPQHFYSVYLVIKSEIQIRNFYFAVHGKELYVFESKKQQN